MAKSKDTKPNTSKQNDKSRRKVLKAGVAVGAVGSAALLPNSWVKPVLRTVVVPAHAKTTDVTTTTTKKPRRTTRRPRRTTRRPKPTTTTQSTTLISDRRLKRDIRALTTLDTGITLYAFKYLWSDTEFVGVMAQDLLAHDGHKNAAIMTETGYYVVDYARLGLRMATLEDWREAGLNAVRLGEHQPNCNDAVQLLH